MMPTYNADADFVGAWVDGCTLCCVIVDGRVGALLVAAAAIVDSRNMFHQAGEALGAPACPTVAGVRAAMARFGFDVQEVHVGLAVARARDRQALARQDLVNDRFRQQVLADGGHVLLGELHMKSSGQVQEKMVDSACCVRITRFVDEIAYGRSHLEAILVLSKDIDLQPAVDYAVESQVPIFVGASDVVQHRPHPYLLFGPSSYAEIATGTHGGSGHEMRETLASMLHAGTSQTWTVKKAGPSTFLQHGAGLRGEPAPGVSLPSPGRSLSLYPVDVTFSPGAFPTVVCDDRPAQTRRWHAATVSQRVAPMALRVKRSDGTTERLHFPQGGVVPGETVLVHSGTSRILGRLAQHGLARSFDPDEVRVVRVISALPRGGALVADDSGRRGLLNTYQAVKPGQRLAAAQVDLKPKGPVWVAIGSPLPQP